jgi:hypothetical protein
MPLPAPHDFPSHPGTAYDTLTHAESTKRPNQPFNVIAGINTRDCRLPHTFLQHVGISHKDGLPLSRSAFRHVSPQIDTAVGAAFRVFNGLPNPRRGQLYIMI